MGEGIFAGTLRVRELSVMGQEDTRGGMFLTPAQPAGNSRQKG